MRGRPAAVWIAVLAVVTAGCRHAPATATEPEVHRYAVVMQERPVGTMVTTWKNGYESETFFTYQDRGRGPRLTLEFGAGADGLPVKLSIRGEDEDQNSVEERFTRGPPHSEWSSPVDSGKAEDAFSFYFPVSPIPESLAHLARALLRAKGGRLPLLPAGEARLEQVARLDVKSVEDGDRRVLLYVVHGLQFGPSFVWLEEGGDFFASGAPFLAVVRRGYESWLPELFRVQAEAIAQRESALAKELAVRPGVPLAIRNARVFDPRTGATRDGQTVVIHDGWILSVSADAQARVPSNAWSVDAGGRVLLPGLWDLHVHPETGGELLHLAAGVVAVRDLGSDVGEVLGRRRAIQMRALLGPRLMIAGLIDGESPNAGPTKVLVRDANDARAAVDRFAQLGFDQVKVYNSVPPALLPVIAGRAHSQRLRLSGHIPAGLTAEEAIRLGLDEVHHAYFLFPSLLKETLADHPEPFKIVLREAPWMDLGSPRVQQLVDTFRERKTVLDPTLALCESLYTGRRGAPSASMAVALDRLPLVVRRRVLATGVSDVDAEQDRRLRGYLAAILRLTGRLHRAGVPLVAGSDGMAGFTLHRELELMVEAGLTPAEVLRIVTLGAAEHMRRERESGSIEVGKRADLVLIDGDPLIDIRAIRRAALVFYDGAVLDPAALYGAVSVRPNAVAAPPVNRAPGR